MFGSRLKSWMENYIVRSKKKEIPREKFKRNDREGLTLQSSESLAHSDTGISSSSQQILSSSTTDNKEAYSTTTMESERSGMTHCNTAVSLPSPESAYSTGYSTDGASPGGIGPPEYYINIRTGKHYFPSPAPTPTSPQPNTSHSLSTKQRLPSSLYSQSSYLSSLKVHLSQNEREPCFFSGSASEFRVKSSPKFSNCFPPHVEPFTQEIQDLNSPKKRSTFSSFANGHSETLGYSKSPAKKSCKSQCSLTSLKLFLKSPKKEREKTKINFCKTPPSEKKKKLIANEKSRKWFKQPFQKFGHRRTDSCSERIAANEAKKETFFEKNLCYLLGQESSASPRQRNRIKTNPWLPTEPMSSQNFFNLKIKFSPSLTRNRSCSNTPLQNRKTNQLNSLQNRIKHLSMKFEESKEKLSHLEKAVNRHVGGELVTKSSDHSEEDLTLNEMMGTYNESYVYEKETDILSDSDPTDCEDYGTDSEAANGGDERDSHDDELDFIDNGSLTESDDNIPRNSGRCTYYEAHIKRSSFLPKIDRNYFRKDSECRKNSKKNHESKGRRDKRRQTRRSFRGEGENKKINLILEEKVTPRAEFDENAGGLNLSRILLQRKMAKNESQSAEGTPTVARRQKTTEGFQESYISNERGKTRETKAEYQMSLGDFEADSKYKELIREAETMFESMRNSPVIKDKSQASHLSERGNTWHKTDRDSSPIEKCTKQAEITCWSGGVLKGPETLAKKSPKDLSLALSTESPWRIGRLEFGTKKQSFFKTKPSAHSPLDPLGPALRNFAVFRDSSFEQRKTSTSSSEESEPIRTCEAKGREQKWVTVPESPVVPIAFQSVDLGKPLTSYCPQSEPVKRKIYSCSKTYDKLVKQFECKPTIFEENLVREVGHVPFGTGQCSSIASRGLETCLSGNQGSSPTGEDRRRNGKKSPLARIRHCSLRGFKRRPTSTDLPGAESPQIRSFDANVHEQTLYFQEKEK